MDAQPPTLPMQKQLAAALQLGRISTSLLVNLMPALTAAGLMKPDGPKRIAELLGELATHDDYPDEDREQFRKWRIQLLQTSSAG